MLMPIMANIGNLQYAVIAIVGAVLALSGIGSVTVGAIVSFLQLSKRQQICLCLLWQISVIYNML